MKTKITYIPIVLVLITCFELLCNKTKAQSFKRYLPSATCVFIAGITDGFRDAFLFRDDKGNNFFNGKQSWLNKYKGRNINNGPAFFGSTSFFVWTTDGAHLANLFTHQISGMAIEIGHSIVYSIIFKPTGRD